MLNAPSGVLGETLADYYPRQVGELFFLVHVRESAFLKVSEAVYELMLASRDATIRERILRKYGLTEQAYGDYLNEIVRALHDT